jgi:hypothetical protein
MKHHERCSIDSQAAWIAFPNDPELVLRFSGESKRKLFMTFRLDGVLLGTRGFLLTVKNGRKHSGNDQNLEYIIMIVHLGRRQSGA